MWNDIENSATIQLVFHESVDRKDIKWFMQTMVDQLESQIDDNTNEDDNIINQIETIEVNIP